MRTETEAELDSEALREDLTTICGLAALALAPAFQENMWITDYDDGERLRKLTKTFGEALEIDDPRVRAAASEGFGELARFAEWVLAMEGMQGEAAEWYDFGADFKPLRARYSMMLADLTMVALTEAEDVYALNELAAWDLGFISVAASHLMMHSVMKAAKRVRRETDPNLH